MKPGFKTHFLVLLSLAGLCFVGCATPFFGNGLNSLPLAGPKNPVIKIVAVWQPAEGPGLDNRFSRGFAGQIYFISNDSETPCRVNGTVRVYLFDDQGSMEEQVRPIHQFDFEPDAWNAHLYKNLLGASYSVFIPYTRSGVHHVVSGLRIRFTPADGGPVIYSEMTSIELPGTRGESSELTRKSLQERHSEQDFVPLERSRLSPQLRSQFVDRGWNVPKEHNPIYVDEEESITEDQVTTYRLEQTHNPVQRRVTDYLEELEDEGTEPDSSPETPAEVEEGPPPRKVRPPQKRQHPLEETELSSEEESE